MRGTSFEWDKSFRNNIERVTRASDFPVYGNASVEYEYTHYDLNLLSDGIVIRSWCFFSFWLIITMLWGIKNDY